MKYLLMYIWKLIYFITAIIIVIGTFFFGVEVAKMIPDFFILQALVIGAIWAGGSYILAKPLIMLDKLLEDKASLDNDARISFFVFVTLVLISLAVLLASIFLFNMWLELINDTINRTIDDYFTIIFPLVLLISSIGSLIGSFNLYKKYKKTKRIYDSI